MMRKLILLYSLLFSLTCTSTAIRSQPEITPYLQDFRILTGVPESSVEKVDVSFRDFQYCTSKADRETVGMCSYGEPHRIEIDPCFWKWATAEKRWALVLHEAGHCLCNLPHSDEYLWILMQERAPMAPTFPDGCPVSLMVSMLPTTQCIQRHYVDYALRLRYDCLNRGVILK